jgi:hypothetical protein
MARLKKCGQSESRFSLSRTNYLWCGCLRSVVDQSLNGCHDGPVSPIGLADLLVADRASAVDYEANRQHRTLLFFAAAPSMSMRKGKPMRLESRKAEICCSSRRGANATQAVISLAVIW